MGGTRVIRSRWLRTSPSMCALAILATATASVAAPAKTAPPEPSPALPAPQVTLKVTPGAGGAPWRLQIENKGEGPVRIPADPRLLVIDLTPAATSEEIADTKKNAKKKDAAPPDPRRCVLPDDTRPTSDETQELIIPAARSLVPKQ